MTASSTKEGDVRSPRGRRGFALIIVISLLALLVLALVSLATLTRIETQVGANSRKQAQARQNARFALEQALGELQRHAGADARITATASIAGDGVPAFGSGDVDNNAYWTGVWDAGSGSVRTWLVSRNENAVAGSPNIGPALPVTGLADGMSPLSAVTVGGLDARLLVGPACVGGATGDSQKYVVAPLVDLEGPVAGQSGNETVGRYAWWVGDEGVKAQANLRDPYSSATASPEELGLRRTVAQRVGVEQIVASYPANHEDLDRVIDRWQLAFVSGMGVADVRDHFHDLTSRSMGVLADVTTGRLRRDLNRVLDAQPAGYEDNTLIAGAAGDIDGDPRWGALRAFYNQRWDSGAPIVPFGSSGFAQGIHPFVTAMSIWPGVVLEGTGTRLHVTCRATITISNPYDVPLAGTAYTIEIGAGTDMAVRIERSAGAGTQPIAGVSSPIPLAALRTSGPLVFETPVVSFAAGEVKIFSTSYDAGSIRSVAGAIPLAEGNPSGGFEYFSVREFLPMAPATEVIGLNESVAIRLDGGRLSFSLGISGGAVLQSIEDVQINGDVGYRMIAHEVIDGGDLSPQSHLDNGTGFTAYMRGAAGIAAIASAPSARGTTNNVRWVANHSPRAPALQRPSGDPWTENPLWDGVRILNNNSPYAPIVQRDLSQALWGRSFEPGVGSSSVVLYHVLRREPISLGEFQHASFSADPLSGYRMASYPIGNSYASPYVAVNRKDVSYGVNEVLFDGFFSSGFVGSTMPTTPLPSRRLVRLSRSNPLGLTHDNVAGFLLVDGAFNVNSTSESAWAALFASLNGVEDPNAPGDLLGRPFFRTPYPTDSADNPRGGIVTLSEAEIESLALNIVSQVRARGPFTSIADFVNRNRPVLNGPGEQSDPLNVRGALQAAIDSTSGVQPSGASISLNAVPNLPSLPFRQAGVGATGANLSGWLSQADVLTALAPILSARSDTFVIRAYGETVDPLIADAANPGYVQSRAWCEAVVQRMPEFVDSSDAPWEFGADLTELNQRFGRRFIITSFRWLTPDDI